MGLWPSARQLLHSSSEDDPLLQGDLGFPRVQGSQPAKARDTPGQKDSSQGMGSQRHNCGQRRRQQTKALAFSKPNRETRWSGKPPCVWGTHRAPGSQGSLEPEHTDGKFQSSRRVSQRKAAAPPSPDLPQLQVRLGRQTGEGMRPSLQETVSTPVSTVLWRRQWQPISLGQGWGGRSPAGGHGNPLQCSCLENPRDGGAWLAAVYGVAQSRTRLKRLSSSSSPFFFCPQSFPASASFPMS